MDLFYTVQTKVEFYIIDAKKLSSNIFWVLRFCLVFCRANTTSSNNELRKHQVVTPANTHSSSGVAEEATKLTTTVTTTSSEDHNSRLSCVVCRLVDMCSCDTHRNMTSSASSSGKRKRRSSTKVSKRSKDIYYI